MKNKVLLTVLFVLLLSVTAFAYTSDRMEFGDVDFGGETVTIIAWYDPLEDFKEGGDYAGRLDEAKELFNIGDFEVIQLPWGEELQETMISRLMAGDSEYDFWMLPADYYVPVRAAGAMRPVNDIVDDDYYANMPRQHQELADAMGIDGDRFTFSAFNGIQNNINLMMFNKDLLEREGLPDPYELYENDEWNWDTITDMAVSATKDTNNDGETDQFGFADIAVASFIFSNNGDYTRREDGKVIYAADMPETVEALRKVRELRHELNVQGGTWRREVFFDGQAAFATMQTYEIPNLVDSMEDSFGFLPMPKGPDADDYVYSSSADSLVLPANAAQPEAMIALDNFLWPVAEFEERQETGFVDRAQDHTSYTVLQESVEKWDGKIHLYGGILGPDWDGIWGEAFTAIMNGESSAAGALAEIAPVAQSALDEALNQ
ncbi:MAG: ABC transporter substrate-binding protein [Halanaerobiaceae bacterium]